MELFQNERLRWRVLARDVADRFRNWRPAIHVWYYSTIGASPNYTGGTRCDPGMANATCVDCTGVTNTGTTLPSCGAFCTPVMMGAPSLAADGHGNTVYVGLADIDGNVGNGAERVVAMVSVDGGQHFKRLGIASIGRHSIKDT